MAKSAVRKVPRPAPEEKETGGHCTLRFISGVVDITPGASREPMRDDEWCRLLLQLDLNQQQRQRLADWVRGTLMKLKI